LQNKEADWSKSRRAPKKSEKNQRNTTTSKRHLSHSISVNIQLNRNKEGRLHGNGTSLYEDQLIFAVIWKLPSLSEIQKFRSK